MPTHLILSILRALGTWIPVFCVVFIKKNKAIAYTLGSFSYAIAMQLVSYYFCIENPGDYCRPENHELFTHIIVLIMGFIYCLIIELIGWGFKTIRDYVNH